MKLHLILVVLTVFLSASAKSNSVYIGHLLTHVDTDDDFTENISTMELIFFLRPEEKDKKMAYEKVFKENWTICNYRIVEDISTLMDEVKSNPDRKKCFLSVLGIVPSDSNPTSGPYEIWANQRHYLCLWRPEYRRNGELYEDGYMYMTAIPLVLDQKKNATLLSDEPYDERNSSKWYRYHNWSPAYLGLYLRMTNYNIKNNVEEVYYSFGHKFDHSKAKALYTGELLIPDYTFNNRVDNHGSDYNTILEQPEKHDEKALMAPYQWKYRIVSEKEMEEALNAKKKGTYYLFFQRGGFSVLDIETGQVVLHFYFPMIKTWSFDLDEWKMEKFVSKVTKLK